MADAAQHAIIGAVAGGGTYLLMCRYYDRQMDFGEFLVCAGIGLLAGGVPDLFEPAAHPHHRQFAHSFTVGGLLAKFMTEKCGRTNGGWDEFQKIVVTAAVVGYLSHLLADACTPRSLPLI